MSGSKPAPGALEGVRVVELAHERTAFAGKLLADMGADVVLVEPPDGAPMRRWEPFVGDREDPEQSLSFWHWNTNKRGVVLDLESGEGRSVFRKLLERADVLIEGEAPGRLASLGLGSEGLLEDHPELIVASITPFGQHTAKGDAATTDATLLAGGGPVWSCGYDDHSIPPVRGLGGQATQVGGTYGVMAILTAFLHRSRSGEGQRLDVSLHAAANVTTEMSSYHWLVQRGTVHRQTGRHALEQPSQPTQTRCADGRYVSTGVPPRWPHEFRRLHEWLCELGLDEQLPEAIFLELGATKDFIDLSKIGEDDEVTAIMGAGREALDLIARSVSAYDFFIGAQECGLTAGIVYSPEEAFEDSHFEARGFQARVRQPQLDREIRYPGAPYRFEKSPWSLRRAAPSLGEHDAEVLGPIREEPSD